MSISPYQIILVHLSFIRITLNPDQFTRVFYDRLFELDPKLRLMFKGDMKEQYRKLIDMFTVAISSLENFETIAPILRRLGQHHAQLGVTRVHYELMRQVLLWSLEQVLKSEFTTQAREAWLAVYTLIADAATADAYAECVTL